MRWRARRYLTVGVTAFVAGCARTERAAGPETQADTLERAKKYAPLVRAAADQALGVTVGLLASARGDEDHRPPRPTDRYDTAGVRRAFAAGYDTLARGMPAELAGLRDRAHAGGHQTLGALDTLHIPKCPDKRCPIGERVTTWWNRFVSVAQGMQRNSDSLYITLYVSSDPNHADAKISSFGGQPVHGEPTNMQFRTWRAEFLYEVRRESRVMRGDIDLVTQPSRLLYCDFAAQPAVSACNLRPGVPSTTP